MSSWKQTRRQFLGAAGGAGGLILLGARTSWAQGPRVRKNVAQLTEAEIASLERGVAAMKRWRKNFAVSWAFQANIHGYNASEERQVYRGWGSCQHGSWWFLPWHRGYLLYFERILRVYSGDPNLTLPYWDWTNPDQRSLPARFLDPRSPLYEINRSFGANNGGELSESAIQWERALAEIPFSSSRPQRGFGGQVAGRPGSYRPHGALESLAHDLVHDQIGGYMGSPNTAGRDPIFWLHHANVDRLWGEWLRRQEGRYNPEDAVWLDTPFDFYGSRGVLGQATSRQILQTTASDYRYDTEPAGAPPLFASAASPKGQPSRRAAMAPERPRTTVTLAAQAPARRELGSQPVSATFKLGPESKRQLEGVLAAPRAVAGPTAEGPTVRVAVEDIRFDAPPGRIYEVYVNLPDPADATGLRSPYFAGTISFFGLHTGHTGAHPTATTPGATAIVDVTEAVRNLREQGKLQDEVKVTLIPQTMKVRPRAGAASAPRAVPKAVTEPRVTFGAIRLLKEGD